MIPKPHQRVYVLAFLMDCALKVGLTCAPFFVYDYLGGGAAMSGAIAGLLFGLYAVVCLVLSRYVARARNGLRWAVAGLTVFVLLFPLAPLVRHPWFFGGMLIAGFSALSMFWPAVQSWLGAEPNPRVRNKRISTFNITWTTGLAVGTLLSGPLYDMHYALPYALVFLLAAMALALVLSLPHERTYHAPQEDTSDAAGNALSRRLRGHLYTGWISNMVGCALVGSSSAVFSKQVEDLVDAGILTLPLENMGAATLFSWLSFALCATRAVTFFLLGRSHRWLYRFWVLALFQLAAAGAFWVLGASTSLAVMICCFMMVGVGAGVAYFASLHYSLADPAHKHRRASVHEASVGIGNLLGCLGFGILAERYGTTWPFTYTPLFVLVAIGLQFVLVAVFRPRGNRRETSTP